MPKQKVLGTIGANYIYYLLKKRKQFVQYTLIH